MSLKAQLAALRAEVESDLSPGALGRLQTEAAAIGEAGTLKAALKAGDTAPDFRLSDGRGGTIRLSDLLDHGPVVISFYRGDWCRFCDLALNALAEVAGEIGSLGASLIAIAPQAAKARRRKGADAPSFPLLVDTGAKIAKSFGLAFTSSHELEDAYEALGRRAADDCATALPVPATYIVAPSGTIVFSYLDSDFTSRLEPADIVVALRRMRESTPPQPGGEFELADILVALQRMRESAPKKSTEKPGARRRGAGTHLQSTIKNGKSR